MRTQKARTKIRMKKSGGKSHEVLIIDGDEKEFGTYAEMKEYLASYLQGILDGPSHDEIIDFYANSSNGLTSENIDGKALVGELTTFIRDDWADEEDGMLVYHNNLTDENRYPEEVGFFGNIELVSYVADEGYSASAMKAKHMKKYDKELADQAGINYAVYELIDMVEVTSPGSIHVFLDEGTDNQREFVPENRDDMLVWIDNTALSGCGTTISIYENGNLVGMENIAKSRKAKHMKKEEKKTPIKDDDVVEIEEEDGKKVVEIESKEEHEKEVESGEEKDSDNLNAGKKKSARKAKVMKGLGLQAEVDYEVNVNIFDANGNFIATSENHDISGFNAYDALNQEISEYVNKYPQDFDLLDKSAKKSINNTIIGNDTMSTKKAILMKELEELDEKQPLEDESAQDKDEVRGSCKSEEPEEVKDEDAEEKCKSARKGNKMKARKGMRKAEAEAEAKQDNEMDEVAEPKELVSGEGSATPEETIVDEVEDPKELDDNTDGAENKGNEFDENVMPEELDKLRRARIQRAMAKRRMIKSRELQAKRAPQHTIVKGKVVRRAPVHKFSVATRGSERYDGRENYNQSPMMRQCIDNAFPRSKEEAETVKQLNKRLDDLRAQSRNGVRNPIGKKRIH